jgi:hypothetical protein
MEAPMKFFASIFKIKLKSFFKLHYVIAGVLLIVLALAFCLVGIIQFKDVEKNVKEFREFEDLKVLMYFNYTYYGVAGLQLLMVPGPNMVLFHNSTAANELKAHIDVGDVLNIFSTYLGKGLFREKPGDYKDFSGVILLFGSLLALFIGFQTPKQKEFLRFISGMAGLKKTFAAIILAKVILFFIYLAVTMALAAVLMVICNVPVTMQSIGYMLYFLVVMTAVILFFDAWGTLLGSFKNRITGGVLLFVVWFVSIFLIPAVINSFMANSTAQFTSNSTIDITKLKILMDFENNAKKEYGKKLEYKKRKNQKARDIIEKYWNKDFKVIQDKETKRRDRMKKQVDLFHIISMLYPSSSYLAACQDLSSGGYKNVIDFYDYVCNIKNEYVRFYLDKQYYDKSDKVVNFVNNHQNIYASKSIVSISSIAGLLIAALYTVLLYFAAYLRCKQNLFSMEEKEIQVVSKAAEGKIEFTRTEPNVWKVTDMVLAIFLYIFFTIGGKAFDAKKRWKTRILVDDRDITQQGPGDGFLYICRYDDIPGCMSMDDFVLLVSAGMKVPVETVINTFKEQGIDDFQGKKYGQLKAGDMSKVLLALTYLKGFDVYLVNDIARGRSMDFAIQMTRRFDDLQKQGALAVYLTTVNLEELEKKPEDKPFKDARYWNGDIKTRVHMNKINQNEQKKEQRIE